ncbi:MAG: acylphosphatase, partial [Euryarchaeota archaeon]|nr:acylphosphatase [Euryarchaeota archaeon]
MDCRVYVLVSGTVQGVFFRASAKKIADELHLTGWVRNLDDGRVEAIIEG